MLVMLPRLEIMDEDWEEEARCIPINAAAKLLTNRALLPVDDLDTMTCATVSPATQPFAQKWCLQTLVEVSSSQMKPRPRPA